MMGPRQVAQGALFYEFSIEDHVPPDHLLRAMDRFVDLGDMRRHVAPFYSWTYLPYCRCSDIMRIQSACGFQFVSCDWVSHAVTVTHTEFAIYLVMTLEELDAYLASEDSPEDCMMLCDLDGFIHGIACSAEFVPAEEWVPVAFGNSPEEVPEKVLEAVVERYADICRGLTSDPPELSPIFWQAQEGHLIAMDWCEGFLQAVALRPREWLRLTESGSHGFLMTPIMIHILDDEGNSALGIPQEDLDDALRQAAEKIPESIFGIHEFWATRH